MYSLYKLTFSSGKCYIGQTTRKMITRISQHRQSARTGSSLAVHCAWRMHGEPVIAVLGEFDSQESLHKAEIAAIKSHGTLTPYGYNVSIGGDTAPSKRREVAEKIGKKSLGRKHSEGVKAAMSEASKAHWLSQEYRDKVSSALKEVWTPERRAERSKLSKAAWEKRKASGWVVPESTKEKLRTKVVSDETKAKMSAAAKVKPKKPRSAETRLKLSDALKTSWQDSEARARRSASISEALKAKHASMSEDQKAAFSELRKRAWETRRTNAATLKV